MLLLPWIKGFNLTGAWCMICQMIQIWLTSGIVLWSIYDERMRRTLCEHRDSHDDLMLARGAFHHGVRWGFMCHFWSDANGIVDRGVGGVHIWGRYGGWWMCGILDGWACVTSLSCEGPQYITSPAQGMMYWQRYTRPPGDIYNATQVTQLCTWPLDLLMKLQPIDSSCSEFTHRSPQVELMAVMWPALHID